MGFLTSEYAELWSVMLNKPGGGFTSVAEPVDSFGRLEVTSVIELSVLVIFLLSFLMGAAFIGLTAACNYSEIVCLFFLKKRGKICQSLTQNSLFFIFGSSSQVSPVESDSEGKGVKEQFVNYCWRRD